ncbi:hypothetical protein RFI_28228 [Reticulomyxa filosa]|uniref:Uncharacterized protein n=1 Tax=Reticulomyxa filosa TaxID=46433 RepID=X6M804_RETFI|nr:hypothetical protein RFI_28228 [Reticulomyxa filosa]|eukprot:ETO09160.1 hypothetical protein RFI_28228 [Reticulomyxa filosa]
MVFYCQKIKCKKTSCYHCKKEVKKRRLSDELDEKEFEDHFECATLAKPKAIWDKALQEGATVSCPKCGIGGMKNNGCTHMTCPKCLTAYCYVNHKKKKKKGDVVRSQKKKQKNKQTELDKGSIQGNNTILLHNEEWETNPKRCPMWLENIHKIDQRWPSESDECVIFFHQIRTKQKLKEAIAQIGSSDFAAICRKFNVDQNSGFDIRDITRNTHVIIKYIHTLHTSTNQLIKTAKNNIFFYFQLLVALDRNVIILFESQILQIFYCLMNIKLTTPFYPSLKNFF